MREMLSAGTLPLSSPLGVMVAWAALADSNVCYKGPSGLTTC